MIDVFGRLKPTIKMYHSSDTSRIICVRFRNMKIYRLLTLKYQSSKGLVSENVRVKKQGNCSEVIDKITDKHTHKQQQAAK